MNPGSGTTLEHFITSSEDGWLEQGSGITLRTAGEEVSVGGVATGPTQPEYAGLQFGAMSASGHFLFGRMGQALNLVAAVDCLTTGEILATGP